MTIVSSTVLNNFSVEEASYLFEKILAHCVNAHSGYRNTLQMELAFLHRFFHPILFHEHRLFLYRMTRFESAAPEHYKLSNTLLHYVQERNGWLSQS